MARRKTEKVKDELPQEQRELLPNPLVYQLTNPGYTIYHRAALGGLAATVRAWQEDEDIAPEGINAKLTSDTVELSWASNLTTEEALREILSASFKLTEKKLIDLPGHAIDDDPQGLRLAIHNGIVGTFLQHPKMRPGEKQPRPFPVGTVDDADGSPAIFTYKAIDSYAHQKAQGTGLLDGKKSKWKGRAEFTASIPQSVVPGAMSGAVELQAKPEDVLLLLFLMVGSSIFLLRPRAYKEKAQYCVVVPDVVDLVEFAFAIRNIAAAGTRIKLFSNSYLGRIVGGAEEAALRLLIDLQGVKNIQREGGVAGCLAIAMGKVAWDKNQINRSVIVKLDNHYKELGVFRAANDELGGGKIFRNKKGESYVKLQSPVPELVAANLAAGRHWCAHFIELVKDKESFGYMKFNYGGLRKMRAAIKDEDDKAVLDAFHKAWHQTLGAMNHRARENNLNSKRLKEVEQEKMRNAILRAKTSDALAAWFLRFCADATKGGALAPLRDDAERIRRFIFNSRNFERFQNLCLFALVSYEGKEANTSSSTAPISAGGNE
jgi:CRISPR-associated protein Cas8a1/Csx13